MPFAMNMLGLSLRWDFVAQSMLTSEPEHLTLWTLQTSRLLEKSGCGAEAVSRFQEGAQHFVEAVLKTDADGKQSARRELAQVVAGLGQQQQWQPAILGGGDPSTEWDIIPDRFESIAKWGGGTYNPLYLRFHDPDAALQAVSAERAGALGRSLYRRAKSWGYDFSFALKFCFESDSPLETAEEIEARIIYYSKDPFGLKPFRELSVADKIGLYVAFKNKFIENRKKAKKAEVFYHSFPSFTNFLKYFEMILTYMYAGIVKGFGDPEFPFQWMATVDYRVLLLKYPVDFPHHRIYTFPPCLHPYDILYELYQKERKLGILSGSFAIVHRWLEQERDLNLVLSYYRNIKYSCESLEQLTIAMLLMHHQVTDPVIAEAILTLDTPITQYEAFKKYVEEYGAASVFPMDEEPLGIVRVAALYHLFLNKRKRFREKFRKPLSLWRFRLFLKMELHAASLAQHPRTLEELAENIAELARNLEPVTDDEYERFAEFIETLIKYREHQPANDVLLLHLREALMNSPEEPLRAFFGNFDLYLQTDFGNRTVELFLRGYALSGQMYLGYLRDETRCPKFGDIEKRVRELTLGAPPGSLEDPLEWMATLKLFHDLPLSPYFLRFVLENAAVTELGEDVAFSPFEFEATQESLSIHNEIDKELIRTHVKKIMDVADVDQWTKKFLLEYDSQLPRVVHADVLGFFGATNKEEVLRAAEKLENKMALDFIETMVRAMAQKGKWNKEVLESMLFALTWHREPVVKMPLRRYSNQRPASEIVQALEALYEFYSDHFPRLVQRYFGDLGPERKFIVQTQNNLGAIHQRLERRVLGRVKVTLLPSRSKLDAFFGYVAQDCLATEEYALHALLDPTFVPYRLLIGDEWRGTVMTFSATVDGKKLLIVTGINPRLDVTLNPAELVDGIIQGLKGIGQKGHYDLLLIPAHPGTQSSRRAFICPEIKVRFKTRFRIPEGLNFPRRGRGNDPQDYYGNHKDFLVVADFRKDPKG